MTKHIRYNAEKERDQNKDNWSQYSIEHKSTFKAFVNAKCQFCNKQIPLQNKRGNPQFSLGGGADFTIGIKIDNMPIHLCDFIKERLIELLPDEISSSDGIGDSAIRRLLYIDCDNHNWKDISEIYDKGQFCTRCGVTKNN